MAIDPITAGIEAATKIIDKLFPDKAAADAAKVKLLEMQQAGELAFLNADLELAKGQMAINNTEAASDDKFARRWRPMVGWVCAFAFAYHMILLPFMLFVLAIFHISIDLPEFNADLLNATLYGMLGFGGFRTFEKTKGFAKYKRPCGTL